MDTQEPLINGEKWTEVQRDEAGRILPGTILNPNGRPKGALSLVGILRTKLAEKPEHLDGKTYAEAIVDQLIANAVKNNDMKAITEVIDRVDGKPVQSIVHAETDVDTILDNLDDDYKPEELRETEE